MLNSILPFRTATYAVQVYITGTNRLTSRDGYNGVPEAYYIPVEQYAADRFLLTDLQYALSQNWINQQEYDETVSYIPA